MLERLRKVFDYKTNKIESNLPKETLDKITFILKKLRNIYKLEQKEYKCNGYDCNISNILCYGYNFTIKLQNVDVSLFGFHGSIQMHINGINYTVFDNNFFTENGILNKEEFISLVENIYTIVIHFYKDYKHILESQYDYKFFEDSAIKSREEARKDIVKFINNI